MPHFSEEQLSELETIFGLKRVEETLPVRDGVVSKGSMVWWRCNYGPEHVLASQSCHWENIRKYPQAYQLQKPQVQVIYKDE